MIWPLKRGSVPDSQIATWSLYYLASAQPPNDPTIIWGTDVPLAGLQAYLRQFNGESDVLVSPAHVLLRAVGRCLVEHPKFNRRVLRRGLREYKNVNVLMPITGGPRGPEVCLLHDMDNKPVTEIARLLWRESKRIQQGTDVHGRDDTLFRWIPKILRGFLFRHMLWSTRNFNWPAALWGHRLITASTLVNYLGHRGAPPMRSFKPSRFPNEATMTSVTMGPAEPGADGPTAPLFVRSDHRLVDAYELGQFTGDLRRYLMDPSLLDPIPEPQSTRAASQLENARA